MNPLYFYKIEIVKIELKYEINEDEMENIIKQLDNINLNEPFENNISINSSND